MVSTFTCTIVDEPNKKGEKLGPVVRKAVDANPGLKLT